MSTNPPSAIFYQAGGVMAADGFAYVERPADSELPRLILEGTLCYVLTPPQTGKSSLMARTARLVAEQGPRTATIDLASIGTEAMAQWYLSLLTRLSNELGLEVEIKAWWQERDELSPVQRFTDFMREVVLDRITDQVVIFLDEIDATLGLDFRDDFFAAIRAIYDARANVPALRRLTFVLLGAVAPNDLISDPQRTPFTIGQAIDLRDFTLEDAQTLRGSLDRIYEHKSDVVFDRIFYWTGGHPYLTQMLCASMLKIGPERWNADGVDDHVYKHLVSGAPRGDINLQTVHDRITTSPQRGNLLSLYKKIYEGASVSETEGSLEQNYLKLYGLVRTQDGLLQVRNEIYRRVFGDRWIKKHTPAPQARPIRVVAAMVALILVGLAILLAARSAGAPRLVQAPVIQDKYAARAALVSTSEPAPVTFAQANTPIPPSYTSTPILPTDTYTLVPPTSTITPVVPTRAATSDTLVAPTATPSFIPIRSISPQYSTICRNPVTIRWTGQLQLYQVYRVRVRYVSSDSGSTDLPQSDRLTEPVWVAQLPERITLGGERHAIAGEIDWQVLVNDTRTGEMVNMSEWFKFYFDSLTGQPCP